MDADLRVMPRRIEAFPLRFRRPTPRKTPFGYQYGPQTVLVRITDDNGAVGWGEAWGTFPSGVGVEHRAALITTVLAPLFVNNAYESPSAAFKSLTAATRLLVNHSGEPGPIGQAIAGLDIALWDLVARRAGLPLWRLLGGPHGRVPAYASGLDPDQVEDALPAIRSAGYRAFKVRLWGGDAPHAETLRRIEAQATGLRMFADANQSWSPEQAVRQVESFEGIGLEWLEEAIPADATENEWRAVAAASQVPLAGGENIRGSAAAFVRAMTHGGLTVIQPDMCKWGGFSGCLPLAKDIIAAGKRYFPHYLGGGVGFLASAHLLAAAGGDGLLERDFHPNPLRDQLVEAPPVVAGMIDLPDTPGWGAEPSAAALQEYRAA